MGRWPHQRRPRRRVPAIGSIMLVTAVTVGTTACAGDASSGAGDRTTTTSVSAGVETGAPATATVDITDKALSPDDVAIQAGGTVTWINSDTVDHEIVSLDSDVIRSPVLGQGGSHTALFTAPGEYPYYCNIYNFMKGTVVVR